MLKIRLTRLGKKHDPHYRIIVTEARSKRDGKAIEYLGHYDPRSKELKLDIDRAKYWLSVGAKPTETVHSMLAKKKLLKPLKRAKRAPKKPKKEKRTESDEKKKETSATKKDEKVEKKVKTKDKKEAKVEKEEKTEEKDTKSKKKKAETKDNKKK
jgi:small subunit ribosomal protein S16